MQARTRVELQKRTDFRFVGEEFLVKVGELVANIREVILSQVGRLTQEDFFDIIGNLNIN